MSAETRNQTILIIDHDARVNDVLRLLLIEEGFKAIAADDLDAAVHLLSSIRVDLVITNYMEPAYRRGDRWPVLEALRQLAHPDIPFIVLTASPEELNQNAKDLGVAGLIGKPFVFDELLSRITQAIGKSR
jgi:DNA-binding response OmpR family regulator